MFIYLFMHLFIYEIETPTPAGSFMKYPEPGPAWWPRGRNGHIAQQELLLRATKVDVGINRLT